MSDSGFREIQLSGKQVVFLFMAGVVAAVAIFLLGVSVGRGVIQPSSAAGVTPPPTATVVTTGRSGGLPPAQTPAPGELQYHEKLKGSDPKAAPPPAPPPAATSTPTPTPTAAPPAATNKPAPAAPAKPQAKPAPAEMFYVQVDSFASRENASRRQAELKAKGFPASIYTAPGTGAPYKVRMGPMDAEAAEALMARLRKEGYKPSRTR